MSDPQPVCPEHPDRVSAGTCRRCGRFACIECFNGATALCIACGVIQGDPLGVRSAIFSVGRVLTGGWKLFRTAPVTAVVVSLLMALSAGLSAAIYSSLPADMRVLVPSGLGRGATNTYLLISTAIDLVFGSYLRAVLLAKMAGAAQGEDAGVIAAIVRSARAWPRMLWARLVATVLVALGAALCLVPALLAAVVLWVVVPVAYLEPRESPVQTSRDLTRGRRWHVLALIAISRAPIVVLTLAGWLMPIVANRLGVEPGDGRVVLLSLNLTLTQVMKELVESYTTALELAGYYGLRKLKELEAG